MRGSDMRRVITEEDTERINELGGYVSERVKGLADEEAEKDNYRDKILKYIPAEIIGVFIMGDGAIRSYPELIYSWIYWAWFIICFIITPFYVEWISKDPKLPKGLTRPIRQMVITTVAFVVWVISLGGPFVTLAFYHPIIGILLLPLFTLLAPMFSG